MGSGTVSFGGGVWGCGAHTRFLAGREQLVGVGGGDGGDAVRDSLRFLAGKGGDS